MYTTGNLNHRWLKEWGVAVASEGKMRREAAEIVGDNIAAEVAPFTAPRDNTVLQPAPFVYVPHLWEKVQSVLEQNRQYEYAPVHVD